MDHTDDILPAGDSAAGANPAAGANTAPGASAPVPDARPFDLDALTEPPGADAPTPPPRKRTLAELYLQANPRSALTEAAWSARTAQWAAVQSGLHRTALMSSWSAMRGESVASYAAGLITDHVGIRELATATARSVMPEFAKLHASQLIKMPSLLNQRNEWLPMLGKDVMPSLFNQRNEWLPVLGKDVMKLQGTGILSEHWGSAAWIGGPVGDSIRRLAASVTAPSTAVFRRWLRAMDPLPPAFFREHLADVLRKISESRSDDLRLHAFYLAARGARDALLQRVDGHQVVAWFLRTWLGFHRVSKYLLDAACEVLLSDDWFDPSDRQGQQRMYRRVADAHALHRPITDARLRGGHVLSIDRPIAGTELMLVDTVGAPEFSYERVIEEVDAKRDPRMRWAHDTFSPEELAVIAMQANAPGLTWRQAGELAGVGADRGEAIRRKRKRLVAEYEYRQAMKSNDGRFDR